MSVMAGTRATAKLRVEGVVVRHQRRCPAPVSGTAACACRPSFQAQVWSTRDRKTIRKSFPTVTEALAWRQDAKVAVRTGGLLAPSPITLAEAAQEWLHRAEAGMIRTRSGDRYKPAAIRAYRHALECRILPRFGHKRLSDLSAIMLQDFIDELLAAGRSPSTIRNALLPLRAIYRRAHQRGEVTVNPTSKLALPAVRGGRGRVARADEAMTLLAALPASERGLWATALYAGLRMGELQALDWEDIDLAHNLIRVERSWDRQAGYIEPKSRAGKRRVPLTQTLRAHLLNHRLQQGTGGSGRVFTNSRSGAFTPSVTNHRAKTAWATAGLNPISLHECRHTYAAYMIAAGVNPKALSTYMGHSTITITLDRYGHLLPGNEHEAANLLDAWLQAAAS
jgi:integrase